MLFRSRGHESIEWYHVGLDSCSQVNIVNPRFLHNIRPGEGQYVGLKGESAETKLVGDLDGFFECQVCDTCAASVISLSDVEDLYEVSYDQAIGFTVHMLDRDLVFKRHGKIYLADMRDWVTPGGLAMMTVQEREAIYTKRQVDNAKKAGDFVRNAGYPSQGEAIKMIRNGNITNIPVEVSDVKLFYEIYGEPIASIKGKTTNQKDVNVRDNYDEGLRMQITEQSFTTDIMYVAGEKFMVSLAEPLNLIITAHIPNLDQITLGHALQGHFDILQMFGFFVRIVRVDPHKSMVCLGGRFPGTEWCWGPSSHSGRQIGRAHV